MCVIMLIFLRTQSVMDDDGFRVDFAAGVR
jgi:hypothetical protein